MAKMTKRIVTSRTSKTSRRQHLPDDLIVDIQRRLSLPCLRRLCCVSKSWHSRLLNSKFFYDSLFHGRNDDSDTRLLITIPDIRQEGYVYTCLPYDSLFRPLLNDTVFRNFPDELPPVRKYTRMTLQGSCDAGLVCLQYAMTKQGFYHPVRIVGLFNPATSETKILPPLPAPPPSSDNLGPGKISIGFTVMEKNRGSEDDQYYRYKVVSVAHYFVPHRCLKKAHIFSSGHESLGWRELQLTGILSEPQLELLNEIPQYCCAKKKKCYWIAKYNELFYLVSFDSNTEAFYVGGTLPFFRNNDMMGTTRVERSAYMVKEETLVVFNEANEVWVLQQLDTRESWCQLFTIDFFDGGMGCLTPIGLSKHGKVICIGEYDEKNLQVVDVTTGQACTIPFEVRNPGGVHNAQLTAYVPSKMLLSSRRINNRM
ncbi:hypothetical protein LINGRAHAP2_LOCUS8771 [Linum grandiflorum]